MTIALLLHCYQPPTQFDKTLKSIAKSSYGRLLSILARNPMARMTFNLPASLTEQLASSPDLRRWLDGFRRLTLAGQIELTGSAAYHPLLTEIPEGEVRRQIQLNDQINRSYFGEAYHPEGFFPPEMAVNGKVLEIIREEGFAWAVVDESAVASGGERAGLPLARPGLVVRDSELSVGVAFGKIKTVEELKSASGGKTIIVLAMDGETFGHHHPEQFGFLEELFRDPSINLVTCSQVRDMFPSPAKVKIRKSTWGVWERWKDPKNPIHKLQWQLTNLAIQAVCNLELSDNQEQWLKARALLDKSLHSDQYWWASASPFWHYQMVERGARMLRDVVLTVPNVSERVSAHARGLYNQITALGLKLHGRLIIDRLSSP